MSGPDPWAAARLGRSLRERDRRAAQRVAEAAATLDAQGCAAEAGWLSLALVEAELRRPGTVAEEAQASARSAGLLLARGGALRAAVEVWLAVGERVQAVRALRQAGQDPLATRLAAGSARVPLGQALPGISLLGPARDSAASEDAQREGLQGALRCLERLLDSPALLQLYDALGMRDEAARRALASGRPAAAATRLLAAGKPWEAAQAWVRAGEPAQALEALFHVDRRDARYTEVCLLAIELADRLDSVSFELDHLLGPFLAQAPAEDAEIRAFQRMAALSARHGRLHGAIEILEALFAIHPELAEVGRQLADLTRQAGHRAADRAILADDASARGRAYRGQAVATGSDSVLSGGGPPLPELPELPDLPPLPTQAPPTHLHPRRSARDNATRPVPHRPSRAALPPEDADLPGLTLAPPEDPRAPRERSQPTMDLLDDGEPGADRRAEQPIAPGVLVAGRYRVDSLLGRGGMGAVYRAYDTEIAEPVALKVLSVPGQGEAVLARFRQELKLARKLSHRNIVRVHDIGVHAGQRFITMELLQGSDLRRQMDARALPREIGIDLLRQASEGLQAAHDQGIVHRDVKPENLFVTLETVVKVMDFGIARAVLGQGMTMDGAVGGTATYMSPEQASDFSAVSGAADQYSLGVVAYELLCGRAPFSHPALLPLLQMHAAEPPPRPCELDPSIPAAVEEVLLCALQKDPADRFPDCRSFGEALCRAWSARP